MLDRIPLDIFHLIVNEINHLDTLKRLSEVSKAFHYELTPFLYRKLVISTSERQLHQTSVSCTTKTRFLKDGSVDRFDRLSFVKELEIFAPIYLDLEDRCYAPAAGIDLKLLDGFVDLQINEVTHKKTEDGLANVLVSILAKLPEGSLQSFSWILGCFTDGKCGNVSQRQPYSGLSALTQLQHLSWEGLSLNDSSDIKQLLDANGDKLKSLKLGGFYSYENSELELSAFLGTRQLTALQDLSISGMSIGEDSGLHKVVDMSLLRSIKCFACHEVFFGLLGAAPPIKLRSFERRSVPGDVLNDGFGTPPLVTFLKSFEGLEELYFTIDWYTVSFASVLEGIIHHKSTLKRLVLHQISSREYDNDRIYENYSASDSPDVPLDYEHYNGMQPSEIFRQLRLESVGVCVSPVTLKQILEPHATEKRFKLLHLRVTMFQQPQSERARASRAFTPVQKLPYIPSWKKRDDGPAPRDCDDPKELGNFLNWAFGPNGLPHLLIVAVGDFSHNRYLGTTGLFRRNESLEMQVEEYYKELQCDEEDDGLTDEDFEEDVERDEAGNPRRSYRRMGWKDEGLWDWIPGGKEMINALPSYGILDPL
ncbi:hypothetical protein FQN54_009823 [Arachnomyces sp. PD_36]|nr:hypothetical protein FQN54_009823 [Arachnomyces sp. PD_36]